MIVSHRSHAQSTFEQTLERLAANQAYLEPYRQRLGYVASAAAFDAWIKALPAAAGLAKVPEIPIDPVLEMKTAVRQLEAALTGSSLSEGQLKQLHRAVVMLVHPDRQEPAHRPIAEELMKKVNVLIGATLRSAADKSK